MAIDVCIRFVLSSGGSDAADGLTWDTAKATAQAAYGALPATGGVVMFGPGRHNVGAGLLLDRTKPVRLQGVGRWRGFASAILPYTGSDPCLYSYGPSVVDLSTPLAFTDGQGFEFYDLVFEIAATTLYGIYAPCVTRARVRNCMFLSLNPTGWGVYTLNDATRGDDASWWRVTDNVAVGCGLFKAAGGGPPPSQNNSQHNDIIVADNEGQASGATVPFVWLTFAHRSVVKDNSLEGYSSLTYGSLYYYGCFGCQSRGNGGEASGTNYFTVLAGCGGCLVEDIGTSSPTASDRLVWFTGNSRDNTAILHTCTDQYALYQGAQRVFDDDPQKRNYLIAGQSSVFDVLWLANLKRGSGSPEGIVSGMLGDVYLRSDGGAGTSFYVKEGGAAWATRSGWKAK